MCLFELCFPLGICLVVEKAMASHFNTLAWKIPWTEEPGSLQSMGWQRVRHDWVTSLSLFHFHVLEKEMATHSSVLAWRIPGMVEPCGLPSMGLHRVKHGWSNLAAAPARCLVVGLLSHMVVLLYTFKEPLLFSIVVLSIYICTNSARGFPFLHTLSSIYCSQIL